MVVVIAAENRKKTTRTITAIVTASAAAKAAVRRVRSESEGPMPPRVWPVVPARRAGAGALTAHSHREVRVRCRGLVGHPAPQRVPRAPHRARGCGLGLRAGR